MFMENDQEVGLADQHVVTPQIPVQEETKEYKKLKDLYHKVSGDDKEIDWMELKRILDQYTRVEDPFSEVYENEVASAPQTSVTAGGDNVVGAILSLLCGAVCKDTPLAEIIPEKQEVELHDPFFETKNKGFSKDVCRSMIAMLDSDRSGQLNFEEFKRLWTIIRSWKHVFNLYDKNHSGTLSGFELREALASAGYNLNNHTLNVIMHRYGNRKCEIDFDDFIMCAVKLKIMIDLFKTTTNTNTATFTLDDWIETTLYC